MGADDAPPTVVEVPRARERVREATEAELARGATLGRYVVLDALGRGGMGVVYSAYDATLHRRVALKLLHSQRADPHQAERMVAEARTMAQLAHPAIVTVHDVGELDGEVFIAMELVEGETLRHWQARKRPWRVVVAVYARIAEALAFAHDRGVVHRDFKPDNVMIGADDQPRVTDFGLAKVDPRAEPSPDPATSLITKHTISGTRAGTPGYMSPEQQMGATTDARTDQFAFCASLFEALHGELRVDHEGEPRADLPRELIAALERGMADEPEQRWRSMRELHAALVPVPRRRRWPVVAALVAAAAAVAIVFVVRSGRGGLSCDGAGDVSATWSDRERTAIRTAFAANGAGVPPDLLIARLDAWMARWSVMARESCRATERGAQTERVLDVRAECLDRKRARAGDVIGLAATADRAFALHLSRIDLPPVDECADVPTLLADAPDDPARRAAIAVVKAKIDAVWTATWNGHLDAALWLAHVAVAEAEQLGDAPTLSQAYSVLGNAESARRVDLDAAETALWAAIAAQPGRTDPDRGATWANLMWIIGTARRRPDEGLAIARVAHALIDRAGYAEVAAQLDFTTGELYAQLRRKDEALAMYQRALDEGHALDPDIAMRSRAVILHAESQLYALLGDLDHRIALERQALAAAEQLGSGDRLELASELYNMGDALGEAGQVDEAVPLLRRGLAVLGNDDDDPDIAAALHMDLGELARQRGDLAAAEREHRAGLAVAERHLPSTHRTIQLLLFDLGGVLHARGNDKDAEGYIERALAISILIPKDAPDADDYLGNASLLRKLAQIQMGLGQPDRAIASCQRALDAAVREQADPATVGRVRDVLARAEWAAGQRTLARDAMRAAVASLQEGGASAEAAASGAWLAANR